jgi:hypothetical protein
MKQRHRNDGGTVRLPATRDLDRPHDCGASRVLPASGIVSFGASIVAVGDGASNVVVVSSRVELVVLVSPVPLHGQFSATLCPTALRRHTSASVAETGSVPEGAQMHSGEHVVNSTAAFKMNKQSVETGAVPLLSGCEQSPCAARLARGVAATLNTHVVRISPRAMVFGLRIVCIITSRRSGEPPTPYVVNRHEGSPRHRWIDSR